MPENIPTAPGGEQPSPAAPAVAPEAAKAPVAPVTTPVAPAPAAEAKPTIEEAIASADFSKLSDADLAVLESGDSAAIARVLGVVDEPTPPVVRTPPVETPPAEKPKAPNRISLNAIEDPDERIAVAQAMSLVRDPNSGFKTYKAALAHVFKLSEAAAPVPGSPPDDPLAPAAAPPAPAALVVAPEVKAIQDKIAELEAEHTELNDVKFDYAKAGKVMREIGKLEAALVRAELKAESEMSADQAWDAGQTASRARALAEHADLIEAENSEFMDYVDFEISLAEKRNDPILSKPDWPEQISRRVKEKRYSGQANGNTAQAPVADVTQPIPPAPPRARLPGSPIGPAATSGAVTAQVAATEFDSLTFEERAAVLEALDAKK